MIRRIVLPLAAVMTLGVAACSQLAVAAATVNGHKIAEAEVEAELDVLREDPIFGTSLQRDPDERGQQRRLILSQLIYEAVALQEAEARDIQPTQAQADRLLEQAAAQRGVSVEDLLSQERLSRQQARVLAERNVRRFALMDAVIEDVRVDDEIVREVFEAQRERFGDVELAEVAAEIRQALRQQQRETLFQRWLIDRVREADVVVNPKYGRFDASVEQPAVVAHEPSLRE